MAKSKNAVGNNAGNNGKKIGGVTGKGFKPGESGNPSGRPKKKLVTEIYEELLNDPIVRKSIKDACKKRLLSDRMVGGLELKEAAERVEGKVTQPVDIELNVSLADRMQRARERAKS